MSNHISDEEFTDVVDAVDVEEMPQTQNEVTKTEALREKAPSAIALKDGLLSPENSNEEWRVADLMLKSAALPSQFKNVPQVIMAMQFLKQHGLPVMVAIRQTTIINGTLSIWGDLPKALVDRSGLMEEFEEFLFDKNYQQINFENKNLEAEVFGALCRVKRHGFGSIEKTFLVSDAKKANLWDKSIWKLYPKRMLQMRARSLALKDAFPDVLSGIAISEYDYDSIDATAPKLLEKTSALADQLNSDYGTKEETNQRPAIAGSN